MSMIMFTGPMNGQTDDDFMTGVLYNLKYGDKRQKAEAELHLTLRALHELSEDSARENVREFRKVMLGHDLVTKEYNFNDSIEKDLKVYPYGKYPIGCWGFPVLDSFGIVGELKGKNSGFFIDFYPGNVGHTKTFSFLEGEDENLLRTSSMNLFNLKNISKGSAYTLKNIKKGSIDSRLYKNGKIEGLSCEGEFVFGGNNKYPQDMIEEFIPFINGYKNFSPKRGIINNYFFKVDFNSKDGKKKFKAKYESLMQRVHKVFEEKHKNSTAA